MYDVKCMLFQLIDHVCEPRHMWGSPAHGVLKYELAACDLTILKRRVHVPMGEKIYQFGVKLAHGGTWREWQIVHPECVAQVRRLESFGVQYGGHVREYWVDQGAYGDRVIPEHVEWVGDTQVLQDAITYLNMMVE